MLLRLDAQRLRAAAVPAEWDEWVTLNRAGLRIVGDKTADTEIFLHLEADTIRIATDLGELLNDLRRIGCSPEVNPWGISSLLHHGLVRLPRTEYEGVYLLAMGDQAQITWEGDGPQLDWAVDYPWINARSSQDRRPDTQVLLDLLAGATERRLREAGGDSVLMLSSGKDSSAVALALAEAGFRDVPTVTFASGSDDPEPPMAAAVADHLGLKHHAVELPTATEDVAAALTSFFGKSPRACVDLSQIPYALVAATFDMGGAVFDGGGNDSYMGLLPSRRDVHKDRLRIRGRRSARLVARWTPVHSPFNYLARSRAGAALAGRTLRFHETRRLYPAAIDTHDSLWKEDDGHDLIDLYGLYRERHGDPAGSMLKQRLAARSVGMSAALPFCDHDLADYYFNLPEASRFSRSTLTSKVLLRQMLEDFLDYDSAAIGKRYFDFDGAAFLTRHRSFVSAEIDACTLWSDAGSKMIHGWLERVNAQPLLYHALLTVFMISGWHNHSRYLAHNLDKRLANS